MNARTCFWLFGGFIFTMGSTILCIGIIPFRVTHKPRYYILVCPKNDFSFLHLSPLSLSFCSVSTKFSRLSDQSSLVIIKSSSMHAQIYSNISFIFSGKMSGELLTPISRRLYRYLPHGRMILHRLLASLLRYTTLFQNTIYQGFISMFQNNGYHCT